MGLLERIERLHDRSQQVYKIDGDFEVPGLINITMHPFTLECSHVHNSHGANKSKTLIKFKYSHFQTNSK